MVRRLAAAALAASCLAAPAVARAQATPPPRSPAPPASAAPRPPAPPVTPAPRAPTAPAPTTAVGRVAEAIAVALADRTPLPALVVAAPLASDAAAPRGAELANRVASLVAGRLGLTAAPGPLPFEQARTAARAHRALVFVRPVVEGGKLRITADVVPTPRSRWARLRDPTPAPIAHAFAEAPIDAEVRAHLAPIPLTALAPVRGRAFESGVVAAACDDLDADGAPEIVTVSRARVVLLRLRDGKVVPVHARAWADLAPIAPAPLREPIGFAVAVAAAPTPDDPEGARRDVVVSLTDRAESLRLDARLDVRQRYPGLAIPDGDGFACARVLGLVVSGPLAPCSTADRAPLAPSVGGRYDAYASARLVRPDGRVLRVAAGREDGVLEVRDGEGRQARVDGAGAQLAVGDLDQDGAVEILASLDVDDPRRDAVVVRTWAGAAPPREVLRMAAPAGVLALATCPPEGPGRQAFVVATGDAIVVVR